jgi:hypothetical protein
MERSRARTSSRPWVLLAAAFAVAASFGCGAGGSSNETPAGDGPGATASTTSSGRSGGGGTSSASGAGSASSGSGASQGNTSSRDGDASAPVDATAPTDATADATSPRESGAADAATAAAYIENDVFWKDTSGKLLASQGGGVLQVGNTFYWYGVEYGGAATYAASPTKLNSDTSFVAVTCYSSTDLVHWKFENDVLTAATSGATGWVGRVGVAYNATSQQYVLVTQYTGSRGSGVLFAKSPTPTGDFAVDNVQATLPNVVNNISGDQSVFVDDDGQAYLVFSSAMGRSHLYVAPLRPADFLAVQPATQIFSGPGREGNCMYKYGGRYYFNSSDLHGWNASHTYTISASNILGPYSAESVIGNTDADFSHVTQSGLFVTVHGSQQTTVIFGGDRWSDFAGNGLGYNQWTPLVFNGTAPSMQSMTEWAIDPVTGLWSVGPHNNYALNPSFEADRVTMTQPAGWVTTTTTGGGVTPFTNQSGGRTGRWKWALTATTAYEATIAQTLTGLPNGTYTLAAWVESSGGQASADLFASGYGGAEMDAPLTKAMSSWTAISIPGIQVTNGTCQIGARTTANANQFVDLDDVTFIKN